MANTLGWILAGIVAYWLGMLWLRREGLLPESVGLQGPITTLHTKRGKALLDRIAQPRRFWRAWSNFGVGVALVVMFGSFLVLLNGAFSAVDNPQPSAINEPRNVLVIPGINDFLPLSVAPEIVFGLLVGLVVHEGGHGLLCRVEDIEIESMGLALFTILPIGAFVEPDEQSRRAAGRGAQTRMFAAGVTNNFALTIVVFALLFGPVVGSIAVAPGAAVGGVLPNSPAAEAGIAEDDRITAVDGRQLGTDPDLSAVLANASDRTVEVTYVRDGDERTATVERYPLIVGTSPRGPASLPKGQAITAINGTSVGTEAELREELADREVATLSAAPVDAPDDRTTVTAPVGSYARVTRDDSDETGTAPLAEAGAPEGAGIVVVGIDGERIISTEDLLAALDERQPGDTVSVVAYVNASDSETYTRETYEVTLGENPRDGSGLIGVSAVQPGITGLTIDDFGVRQYPAGRYLAVLGGDGGTGPVDSFVGRVLIVLFLPVVGVVGGPFPYNFAGFTGGITNFYLVEGALEPLGSAAFVLANALFWTGWINIQLGFFNCIPAFPLDGGHILRTSTEAVVSRLPGLGRREVVRAVTTTVGLTMLASFLLMIFGPRLFG